MNDININKEQNSVKKQNNSKISKIFTSNNEKFVAILGNSYIENYVNNGRISRGFAVVSNKRCYFNGESFDARFSRAGKRKFIRTRRSRVVDLKDITGTGYDSQENIGLKILFLTFFVLTIISLILAFLARINQEILLISILIMLISIVVGIIYLKSRNTFVTIQFSGGEIAFPVKWFTAGDVEEFQRKLRIAKDDALEEHSTKHSANNVHTIHRDNNMCASADEILKYAELLNKGIITQEEFDRIKQKII